MSGNRSLDRAAVYAKPRVLQHVRLTAVDIYHRLQEEFPKTQIIVVGNWSAIEAQGPDKKKALARAAVLIKCVQAHNDAMLQRKAIRKVWHERFA